MSSCPKCGKKLRLLDLGQRCPHCGVNMRFYDFDRQFLHDAKMAELSMARVHVKLHRFKTAFIGGRLAVIRLCVALLPLISALLPTAKAVISLPFSKHDIALSALGLYKMLSDGTLGFISAMTGSVRDGAVFSALRLAVLLIAVSAVLAALIFLLTLFCFISIKKMSAILCAVAGLGAVASTAAAIFSQVFCSKAQALGSISLTGELSFGFIPTILLFTVVFAVNLVIAKNGLPIQYEEGDLERVEIFARVRRGEIDIEDLPQPIVETAETRAIDEEIGLEQERFREKEAALI